MKVTTYDVIVVGGGAAGVGVGITLKDAGIENFVVIDRDSVGSSFERWPAETRFITPSFPTNSIGMLDLNSIAIGVSPAFAMQEEHPTGQQYAAHLRAVARHFELPVREGIDVIRITKFGDEFLVDTADDTMRAKHVIWAAGEYQYPQKRGFIGCELCRHTATIESYAELEGDQFIVIGGYESGIDAAYHLANRDKQVQVFDLGSPWDSPSSDPSIALSTFSFERVRDEKFYENVQLHGHTLVSAVALKDDVYHVSTLGGKTYETAVPPLYAGGFVGSHVLVADLFESREDGFPLLNEHDESTTTPGLFLCGPGVRHGNHVFCFIYKYRQRFAVVAKAIATSLGLPAEALEHYRQWGMYLDDLSCCGEECASC